MQKRFSYLALIPARGGSKGIPGKNVKLLGGKPLIAYSIEVAKHSGLFHKILVSTDSSEIAATGKEWGAEVPFLRSPELADDKAAMLPVIQDALLQLKEREQWLPDYVALLQPTAPLRTVSHVKRAVDLIEQNAPDSVVSVVELPKHLSPDCLMRIENNRMSFFLEEGAKITRRQDARTAYMRDGTLYITKVETLLNKNSIYGDECIPLVLQMNESSTIDDMEDWERAEKLIYESKNSNFHLK